MSDIWTQTLLDPIRPCPPGLITWNGSDPAQRFAVYRNNVMVSLIEALADSFPVVEQMVGRDFFRAMARAFVQVHPPRKPALVDYGQAFPEWIADFPAAADLPYLPDLARLERAYVTAFHAPDADSLAVDDWSAILADAACLPTRRLRFQPSLQVIRSSFAVASLWAAHQAASDLPLDSVDPFAAENAWVIRRDWRVGILNRPDGDTEFLTALQSGQSFGTAASALDADPDFDLGRCLAVLVSERLVVGIQPD